MARSRKSIQPLNLYKYDVLIEDRGPRSDYFKISQFDGYFYGGRNAFLVAGAGVLKSNSKILVEILNADNTTVYSAPITQFVEGNSRLIQVEIYNDTPIGAGKIVLLGCTDTFIDGTPVPDEWKDKFNVRWITDVIISPLVENKTPIRFANNPSVVVEEKFYRIPSESIFTEKILVPLNVQLTPKYYNVFQNGYQIKITGPTNSRFFSEYGGGILTGSVTIQNSSIESASIALPITKIFNSSLAESQGSLIYTNTKKLITDGFFSSSGTYSSSISPFGLSNITSSINLQYSKLQSFSTGSAISYAKLRIIDAKTLSGEINKVRVSYKVSTEPGEYVILSDVDVAVQELLAVDSASRIVDTGRFNNAVINDFWYTATMSLQKNEGNPSLPNYYTSSSLVGNNISLVQCCTDLLDAVNATPPIINNTFVNNVSYFVGTRNENLVQLFPRSEYTLAFDAVVARSSASIELEQSDYSMEVYLVTQESSSAKLLETNQRGQLLGILTPSSKFVKQNFEGTEFNFVPKIIESGKFGIRFIVYGGHWSIANISLKPAQEPFFSPDEIDILVPNINYADKILSYKLQYLDINNNSIGISTISTPTYFSGSDGGGTRSTTTSSYAATASFITHQNPGDNRIITSLGPGSLIGEPNLQFDGSTLSVTGSLNVSGSSTLRNIGSAQFTGSVEVTEGITGSLFGTASFVLPSGLTNQNLTLGTVSASQLTVQGNLTVLGSSSIQYITSSQLNVGTNLITVNVQPPIPRFGGLAVIDSGSSPQRSGSLLFDSQNDQWIFVHQNQTSPTSSVLLMGPQTYNNIGNETSLTRNYLPRSNNAEHLGDSQIYDSGSGVGINTTTPAFRLDVNGGAHFQGGNAVERVSSRGLRIGFNTSSNTGYIEVITGSLFSVPDVFSTSPYPLRINNQGGTVTFGGSVGIGTTSPGATLHVQGNISASGYTGSLFGTASQALTSSFTTTASAATSITFIPASASFATTSSFINRTGLPSASVSASSASSPSQGTVRITINGVNTDVNAGVQTTSNVQFNSLGVGTGGSGTAGEIRATNNITAYYSDERLKDFHGPIPNALDKVMQITGYYFKENQIAKSLGYNNDKMQVGVSAQEILKVLPEVVTTAPIDEAYYSVHYDKLVPLLIQAIKELTTRVTELENK